MARRLRLRMAAFIGCGLMSIAAACARGPDLPRGPAGPIPCPLDEADRSQACWDQEAPYGSGAFPDDWSPGKFPLGLVPLRAFRDELWMVGRTAAWSSADGRGWARHPKDDWGERIGHAQVFFKGELWMFGGLEYQDRSFLNDVWRSADGERWTRAGVAAWPGREGATVVAFRDRLWLLGGAVHVTADRSPDQFVNDVWSSGDGLSWQQVSAAAPWPPMDSPRVFVFQDALHLVGGQGHAEVWRSTDGAEWSRLGSGPAAWGARYDQGAALFDGKLWVYGGEPAPRAARRSGTAVPAFNDVWYSADAVTWQRQTEHAPWTPRSGGTSAIFADKLWLYSGKHTGAADNWGGDVWTMRPARPR